MRNAMPEQKVINLFARLIIIGACVSSSVVPAVSDVLKCGPKFIGGDGVRVDCTDIIIIPLICFGLPHTLANAHFD